MSHGQRTYSALSDLEYRRDRVAEEDKHKTIQEALAGFLNDEVLDPKGEQYYDGRLELASVDYNIDLDDPNFDQEENIPLYMRIINLSLFHEYSISVYI
uniref:Uncharacterized protein n=1 Tax=Leersia perrieri TaxID=77586 RepID=A0A0D9WW31_9ORYZ